jgi:hypothetical protein
MTVDWTVAGFMISLNTTYPGLVSPLAEPSIERIVGGSVVTCIDPLVVGGTMSACNNWNLNPDECYLLCLT